jgi:hypothetical protein
MSLTLVAAQAVKLGCGNLHPGLAACPPSWLLAPPSFENRSPGHASCARVAAGAGATRMETRLHLALLQQDWLNNVQSPAWSSKAHCQIQKRVSTVTSLVVCCKLPGKHIIFGKVQGCQYICSRSRAADLVCLPVLGIKDRQAAAQRVPRHEAADEGCHLVLCV